MEDARIAELCAGVGGIGLGLERAGLGRVAWQAEIAESPRKLLALRFPHAELHGDITAPDFDPPPVDLLCAGFPCFITGTLVLTEEGHAPIEEVRVGQAVLTHLGRWRTVTAVGRTENADVRRIKAGGIDVTCTDEHPFYAREAAYANDHRRTSLGAAHWKDAAALSPDHFLAQVVPEVAPSGETGPFWRLVGRYLADGWLMDRRGRENGRAVICCAHDEADDLLSVIAAAGYHATVVREETVTKFHVTRGDLYRFLLPFGRGAAGKRLPRIALELPSDLAEELLAGWLDGDGYRDRREWRGTTVSKALALGMALVAQRARGIAAGVRICRMPRSVVIEGRTVNQRDFYVVSIPDRNRSALVEGDLAWKKVKKNEPVKESATVYNLAVEEDESYVADGAVVHNCQPFSQAGRQKGLADARWLWPSIARIVEQARPDRIVLENVPDLCRMGLVPVLADLASLGYDCQWDVVPAVAVGAPHLRFRFLMVAYLPGDRLQGRRVFAEAPVPADYWRATPEPLPRLLPLSENRKGHPQRLTALGNSVVPQLFAWLGWRILACEEPLDLTPQLFPITPADLNAGPKSGALVDGQVHELPRSCPDRKTNGEVWPTPAAREDGWPLETLLSMRRADGSPPQRWDERLYHPTTGQIVQRGLQNVVEGAEAGMWPTPTASDQNVYGAADEQRSGERRGQRQLRDVASERERVWPTPQASDGTGGRVETGALDRADDPAARTLTRPSGAKAALSLRTAVEQEQRIWPTPTAEDSQRGQNADAARKGPSLRGAANDQERQDRALDPDLWPTPHGFTGDKEDGDYDGHGNELTMAVRVTEGASDSARTVERMGGEKRPPEGQERLWPTPDTVNRKSRRAMTSSAAGEGNGRRSGGGSSSPPGLAQAAELADGIVPRELQDIPPGELPPAARDYWPTPTAKDGDNSRRATIDPAGTSHAGETLLDAATADLWPTPTANDGKNATVMDSQLDRNGPGLAASAAGRDLARRIDLEQEREMFPTPAAADGDRGPDYARLDREGAGGDDLVTQQHRQAINDGKLERGSSGALNPEWVGWLMGYPAGYTDPADPRTADQFAA